MATRSNYKVLITADTYVHGRPCRAGETVVVGAQDAANLVDNLRGRFTGKDDVHLVRTELRRDAELILKGGRRT